jgi:hypothetical protein
MTIKPRFFIFAAFSLTALSGCMFAGNPMSRLWFYTYSNGRTTGKDTLLTPASFLELRSDGAYTSDFGHFDYGSWNRKDQQLFLTNRQHITYVYPVGVVTGKDMQLTLSQGVQGNFEGLSLPSEKETEDPFALANNRWRIPASHKENDEDIRRRLREHCRFWETYFAWALDKQLETVDVRSTPTLIKIYGNGFGLKHFEDLPTEWRSYFFDTEDCQKASDMIRDIFDHQNIAWAHTDSKYKMFLSAFQQMENYLR